MDRSPCTADGPSTLDLVLASLRQEARVERVAVLADEDGTLAPPSAGRSGDVPNVRAFALTDPSAALECLERGARR